MLSKPYAGWTTISIGEFIDRTSYLYDVPLMLLDGFINNPYGVFCLKFDAEGWEYIIIVDSFKTYIISDRITNLVCVRIQKENLALEVAADIERELQGWVYWGYDTEIDFIERENQLKRKIEKLREIYSVPMPEQ